MTETISRLAGRLIVSCQAGLKDPFHGPNLMAAMARAVAIGGAAAIRANGPEDIKAIHSAVELPVIGIWKVEVPGLGIRITPEVEHARAVADAGASIVAFDATDRARTNGLSTTEWIAQVRRETGLPVMADVSTFEEGVAAEAAGADLVATTLAGYVDPSDLVDGPDLDLVARLASKLGVPVVAEGRISTPELAAQAIELGAYAVVIGHAITRPEWITSRFVAALPRR